jgi:hypothetical protein
MNQLIERYVYEVIKRLPDKERHEVKQELEANIRDMLSDAPTEEETKEVLNQLGDPALLSRKYRQNPRYLISPDFFELYLSMLKLVLPIVGSVYSVLGMLDGILNNLTIKQGAVDNLIQLVIKVNTSALVSGIDGVFQGLVIITIIFALMEYTSKKKYQKKTDWTVANLPKEKVPKETRAEKGAIPLSRGIGELAAAVCATCVFVLFCLGWIPGVYSFHNDITHIITVHDVFEPSFLRFCILVFLFVGLCNVIESVVKIKYRRWCIPVCVAVVVCKLLGMGAFLFLLTRSNILLPTFLDLLAQQNWGDFDLMRFTAVGNTNPILLFIGGGVLLGTIISCIQAIMKTMKNH